MLIFHEKRSFEGNILYRLKNHWLSLLTHAVSFRVKFFSGSYLQNTARKIRRPVVEPRPPRSLLHPALYLLSMRCVRIPGRQVYVTTCARV